MCPRAGLLVDLAKQGRIGVQGFYGNQLTGICSHEELTRLVDYCDYLRKSHGIESQWAMMTDVPTMVGTVPIILAGHGIKYLSRGVNTTRARGDQELYSTPHYWESPDGGRVLTWRVPAYGYASQIVGASPDTPIAVASIYEKELKRELVDSSQYGLNEYLYVSGGENGRVMNCDLGQPVADLEKHVCSNVTLKRLTLPGRQVMRITADAPMAASFVCDVTLYDEIKRIDFSNSVGKLPTTAKEALYFTFPFASANPEMRIEMPNGVIRPDADQVKAACRDWYCAQHFVTVSDGSAAVVWSPIDTPLLTVQDIFRGQWYDRLKIENGSIFAYAMNNYWFTNYKASQQAKMTFRFSITSAAKVSDSDAKRFGESVQSPMVAIPLSVSPEPLTASKGYVSVDAANVVIQAMAPARFADGTMIRLREMDGRSGSVKLSIDGVPFRQAWLCNLAEDKMEALSVHEGTVEVPCRALGLATVVLER